MSLYAPRVVASAVRRRSSLILPRLTTTNTTISGRWFSSYDLLSSAPATFAFDRSIKRIHRENAARAHQSWKLAAAQATDATKQSDIINYDYIREEIALRLVDRLDDIRREEGFPLALDLGAGAGYIHRVICSEEAIQGMGGIGGVRKLVQLDSSSEMLHRDQNVAFEGSERCDTYRLVADEEGTLAFPDGTFDLVISSMSMHWINNLPKVFSEVKRILKPDGCFIFAMIGGTTLSELRASMVLAELEREGGVSPHVGPFVEISDVGNLIQGAGFALPTIDTDTLQVAFPNAFVLMEHLQRMGENNASIRRRAHTHLDTFLATACLYDQNFAVKDPEHSSGEIEASVQVIYAIGWSPHESQQKPLKRGTATHKVGEIVEHHKAD